VQGTPAWVTVTVWPAIVSVALRATLDALAVTLYVTVPFALPLAPAVTVSHAALLVAVHAQPVAAVTLTEPVPVGAGSDCANVEST